MSGRASVHDPFERLARILDRPVDEVRQAAAAALAEREISRLATTAVTNMRRYDVATPEGLERRIAEGTVAALPAREDLEQWAAAEATRTLILEALADTQGSSVRTARCSA